MIKSNSSFDAGVHRLRKVSVNDIPSRSPRRMKPALVTPPGFGRGLERRQRSIDSVTLTSHSTVVSVASTDVDDSNIPDVYIRTIIDGFGAGADLYLDVLKVSKDSSEKDIRIAYFKRGREVLAEEGGVEEPDQSATVGDVSTGSKTRFQAVSMAYEIICNPLWKEQYLQHGLVSSDAYSVVSWDAQSASAVPSSANSRVKWNENVEELVFRKDPAENADITKRKKRKKRRPRILLETKKLDEHLAKLDEEAEQHFVTDFFDDIEASIDGFLKFVETSSVGGSSSGSKKKKKNKKNLLSCSKKKAALSLNENYGVSTSNLSEVGSSMDESEDGADQAQRWLKRLQTDTNESKPFDERDSNQEFLGPVEASQTATPTVGNSESLDSSAMSTESRKEGYPNTSLDVSMEYSSSSGASTPTTTDLESMLSNTKTSVSVDETSEALQVGREVASKVSMLAQMYEQQHQFKGGRGIVRLEAAAPSADSESVRQNNRRKEDREGKHLDVDSTFDMDSLTLESASQIEGAGSCRGAPLLAKSGNQNDEDIFAGLEEESKTKFVFATPEAISLPAATRLRSVSPATNGSMSDLSESVATVPGVAASPSKLSEAEQSKQLEMVAETEQEPGLFPSPSEASSQSGGSTYQSTQELSERDDRETVEPTETEDDVWCDPDSFAETFSFDIVAPAKRDTHDKRLKTAASDEDNFLEYLLAYLAALANDCSALGTKVAADMDWDKSADLVFETCIIPDGDMDCMLEILRREMNRATSYVEAVGAEAF